MKKSTKKQATKEVVTKAGHGDVRLFLIDELPQGLVPFETNCLAEGEVTGHAHRIDPRYGQVLVNPMTKERFLQVTKKPAALTHEEHHTRTVEPGLYRIGIVRETDHLERVVRRVAD